MRATKPVMYVMQHLTSGRREWIARSRDVRAVPLTNKHLRKATWLPKIAVPALRSTHAVLYCAAGMSELLRRRPEISADRDPRALQFLPGSWWLMLWGCKFLHGRISVLLHRVLTSLMVALKIGNTELVVGAGNLPVLMKMQINGRGTKGEYWCHLFLRQPVTTLKNHNFRCL